MAEELLSQLKITEIVPAENPKGLSNCSSDDKTIATGADCLCECQCDCNYCPCSGNCPK